VRDVIRAMVLLFQKRFHEGLVNGAVRLTFRFWEKPRVKPGGRYRVHPIGVVEVDSIEVLTLADLTETDAQLAGFANKQAMLDYMKPVAEAKASSAKPVRLFKIGLHHGGDGDRVPGALKNSASEDELQLLKTKLQKLDAAGAWTTKTFRLIDAHPRVAASKLAVKIKMETEPFKENVRKLKKLGLTQSFEVGYELSPFGRIIVESLGLLRA
jgi:hypothetical protein